MIAIVTLQMVSAAADRPTEVDSVTSVTGASIVSQNASVSIRMYLHLFPAVYNSSYMVTH